MGKKGLFVIFGGLAALYLFVTRGERHAPAPREADPLADIKRQVATDAIAQYDIAKRKGSAMDRCAQAGGVKAALLQAQDEAAFARWQKIETEDCAAAALVH